MAPDAGHAVAVLLNLAAWQLVEKGLAVENVPTQIALVLLKITVQPAERNAFKRIRWF